VEILKFIKLELTKLIKKKIKTWFRRREQGLMWDRHPDSIYGNMFESVSNKMTK
jgi:hypothetical protein